MSIFLSTPVEVSNPVIPISTFKKVVLTKHKPLVLCDIDDTVIYYDKDVDYFYNFLKKNIEEIKIATAGPANIFSSVLNGNRVEQMTDYELKIAAHNMYYNYRISNKPKHCDYDGFIDLVERVKTLGGELQFLTARDREATFITRKQFTDIGLNYEDYRVNYTGNRISKGDYIKRYFNLGAYGEVAFIDDLDSYIKTVVDVCPSVRCYKFEYKTHNLY